WPSCTWWLNQPGCVLIEGRFCETPFYFSRRLPQTPYSLISMPLKSFVEITPDSHFPLENLPFGIFSPERGAPRVGVALGEYVVDLSVLEEKGHFASVEAAVLSGTGGKLPTRTAGL